MSGNEQPAAKVGDLNDGQMKEITVGETRVLLSRVKGQFHATSATCPHYGAPLTEGVLCEDRVICPWHQSCFNVKTGEMVEPPALDSLVHFPVRVSGTDVLVTVPEGAGDRRGPNMVASGEANVKKDGRTFVILGAGAAGNMAGQTLREAGFGGRIVMITFENRTPYDRPNLSKDYMQGKAQPEWMPLRPAEFFTEHGIEIMHRKVHFVDAGAKTIQFENGESLKYDSLLLATGGIPRKLNVPGENLTNIFPLRTFDDADRILAALKPGGNAVVVGASFIGMEMAASLTERGMKVTVAAPETVPFEKILGPEIGKMFLKVHQEKGVKFHLNSKIARFEGEKTISAAVLESGEKIPADAVIIGVGVKPATDYLRGVKINADGSVDVDSHLKAAHNLYAAGDIARYPEARLGQRVRIEHWRLAEQLGRTAALNMAGKVTPFEGVPYFWTFQFGVGLDYVGTAPEHDGMIVHGSIEKQDFIAFYTKGEKVLAAAGCNRSKQTCAVHELLRLNLMPAASRLKAEKIDLETLLPK